ncbi:hypothetical protein [Xanthomonas arboricola]|uniref:hypothetical protein n=1 Tax=Xanthomonas arboricola TaxID=56448 RepID=UPI00143011D5|nr:hypothetical protein [Xanthomonas arboricola]NJB93180.1 hypothetical protein [Xanthomonas arboricola]
MGLDLRQLTRDELLDTMAQQLGVGDGQAHDLLIPLVAAVLRRAVASRCPCPRETIIDIATDALYGIDESNFTKACVRGVLDRLIVIGDLLELGNVSSLPGAGADDWVYCAPPTFVIHKGSILILGIEAEDQAAMPSLLRKSIRSRRELRYIQSTVGEEEEMAQQLREAGYLEISKAAWMRLPPKRTADQFRDEAVRRLQDSGGRGELNGLRVLGQSRDSFNLSTRWVLPGTQTGYFVGRRPQAFGSPIWVFVELVQGAPTRYIDLPWAGARFRGCDLGWRIQSALDALSGMPQSYRVSSVSEILDRYEFFSPLPLWVERRLGIYGERVCSRGSLIAYELARNSAHDVDDLVQSRMWFTQSDQGE